MKKILVLALATGLLLVAPITKADDHKSGYQVGTFLDNELQPDGTYTSDIFCGSGSTYTCSGSAGFNAVRLYFVKTDEGIFQLETETQAADSLMRKTGDTPMHFKKEKPNLLDALKSGDKVAFRTTPDRRLLAKKNQFHVFIPRVDNPKKEDKFIGLFISKDQPPTPIKPTDNVKALCDIGKLSGDVCMKTEETTSTAEPPKPAEHPSSDGTSDLVCGAFLKGYASTHGTKEPPADLRAKYCGDNTK